MSIAKPKPEGTVAGLADTVKALRAELNQAMVAGQGEDLKFEIGAVTMEFAVEVSADVDATAGVRFWVVEVGGSGSVGRNATHTVRLEMSPRTRSGQRPLIADDE